MIFVLKEIVSFRYEKKYETVEELKLRFQIFSENLDLIRSTNRKGLSYKLGVNRKFFAVLLEGLSYCTDRHRCLTDTSR